MKWRRKKKKKKNQHKKNRKPQKSVILCSFSMHEVDYLRNQSNKIDFRKVLSRHCNYQGMYCITYSYILMKTCSYINTLVFIFNLFNLISKSHPLAHRIRSRRKLVTVKSKNKSIRQVAAHRPSRLSASLSDECNSVKTSERSAQTFTDKQKRRINLLDSFDRM